MNTSSPHARDALGVGIRWSVGAGREGVARRKAINAAGGWPAGTVDVSGEPDARRRGDRGIGLIMRGGAPISL